jgi:hypothetical protein
MSRLSFAALLLLALVASAAATPQLDERTPPGHSPLLLTSPDGRIETRHLTLRTSASAESAAPGTRLTLRLAITPKPKMHVYAPGQKDVIPLTLVLAPNPDIRPGALRLPESETYFFAPLEETQRVYSKPFELVQEVTIADTRAARQRASGRETITIGGRVRYQACDDTICYLPQDVPVTWTITLEPRS